ncbi:MAG: terpene cyclase/mutase family protein [Planctomycetota bacterium]|jgi:hypothetical protein|nr:terpene cyclase/mutase family protein [Planctomycetota bacterium]
MFTKKLLFALALCCLSLPAHAKGPNFVELTPDADEAIRKGLRFIANRQNADGSWNARVGKNVGICSLALLSLMVKGNIPGRGTYGKTVAKGMAFVLSASAPSGLIAKHTSHGPMYGHGFATLFLAEVYGMTQNQRVRDKLKKGVDLIVRTQNSRGGWRYQPIPSDDDISVTVVQVVALRAARNAGIDVPKATIDNAIKYVRACYNKKDGGFGYRPGGGSGFARTAAGCMSLQLSGEYKAEEVKAGLEYLIKNREAKDHHYFYAHYYAVQAMYQEGEEFWEEWYPKIREDLISRQESDGSWKGGAGNIYGTAMACLILGVPYRYLPIYQH